MYLYINQVLRFDVYFHGYGIKTREPESESGSTTK